MVTTRKRFGEVPILVPQLDFSKTSPFFVFGGKLEHRIFVYCVI